MFLCVCVCVCQRLSDSGNPGVRKAEKTEKLDFRGSRKNDFWSEFWSGEEEEEEEEEEEKKKNKQGQELTNRCVLSVVQEFSRVFQSCPELDRVAQSCSELLRVP